MRVMFAKYFDGENRTRYLRRAAMKEHLLRMMLLAISLAGCASAEVVLDEHLSANGYAAVSAQHLHENSGDTLRKRELDAAKLLGLLNYEPIKVVASAWHQPHAAQRLALLDAYLDIDIGGGSRVSLGKFDSLLGYEPFDALDLPTITTAYGDVLDALPGYHSGIKWDYVRGTFTSGLAVVDSLYSGPFYHRGDAEIRRNAGAELFVSWRPVSRLTLTAGIGYDTPGNVIAKEQSITVFNLWASYELTPATTIAAELTRKQGAPADRGYGWLLLATHMWTPKWSAAVRASGGSIDRGPRVVKLTAAVTHRVSKNLLVRSECSCAEHRRHPTGVHSTTLGALQAIVSF